MNFRINLYSYQERVIEAIESDPSHSQLISMPTGTGKTITFLSAANRLSKKCLILVHREELLKQTLEKASLCGFDEDKVSVICASKKEQVKFEKLERQVLDFTFDLWIKIFSTQKKSAKGK